MIFAGVAKEDQLYKRPTTPTKDQLYKRPTPTKNQLYKRPTPTKDQLGVVTKDQHLQKTNI